MKRGFGKPVNDEQRALRELLYRIIARNFHEEFVDNRTEKPETTLHQEILAKPSPFRRSIRAMLLLLGIAFVPLPSLAQEADLTILAPTEGETIRSRDFTLLFSMTGDLMAARLDHVHWQLTGGDNNTAVDLSGIVDVTAPADGDYSLTVYMASPEHVPINTKRTVRFRVITMGSVLLAPMAGQKVTTSDLQVSYSMFGEPPAGTVVKVGIDSTEFTDTDGDGNFVFRGVANGSHIVTVRLASSTGATLGDSATIPVTVQSALTRQNAARALRSLVGYERQPLKARKVLLKRAKAVLTAMAGGGSLGAGDRDLTASNVRRAGGLLTRCERNLRDSASLRAARDVLKRMSS